MRDFAAALWPIRVNLLIAVLLAALLAVPDQAREALQVLVEDGSGSPVWRTVACAVFASLSIWYWSRNLMYVLPPTVPAQGVGKGVEAWGPRICGVAPFIGLALGFFFGADELRSRQPPWKGMIGAGLISIGVALLMLALFYARRVYVQKREAKNRRAAVAPNVRTSWIAKQVHRLCVWWTGNAELSPTGESILTITFILGAAALVAACTHPWLSVGIGPLGMILVSGGIWVALLTPCVVRAARRRFPPVLGLIILLALSSGADINDNHQVRHLPAKSPPPPLILADFEAWMNSRRDNAGGKKYPVFIVVTEGGGIRNAYWTALVLSTLQDQSRAAGMSEFKDHLYFISGVSGGSVGAAVFAALVSEDESTGSLRSPKAYAGAARDVLSADLLSPLLARGTLPDLAQQFVPWPMRFCDRQRAFEAQIERAWDQGPGKASPGRMGVGFWALRATSGKEVTSVPALLLNTTRVESGERVLVGHVKVGRVPSVFEDLSFDMPLSTAGALSARFPVVTPVGSVGSGSDKTRFADGGYFENSGAATAQQAIRDIVVGRQGKEGPAKNAELHVILLSLKQENVTRPNNFLSEMLSPLRALLNARGARGRDAVTSLAQFVNDNSDDVRDITLFEFSDKNVRLPLGWQLSKSACDEMEKQLDGSHRVEGIVDNVASTKRVLDLLRQ